MRNHWGGSNMQASVITDPPPPPPPPPSGTWDPETKYITGSVQNGWGNHLGNTSQPKWRANSGLPGRLRNTYIGPLCTLSNGGTSIASAVGMLNYDQDCKVRIGLHFFPSSTLNRPGTDYSGEIATLNAIDAGTYDVGINKTLTNIDALNDHDLKRTILVLGGWEVGGEYFKGGPTRNNNSATDTLMATARKNALIHVRGLCDAKFGTRKTYPTYEFNTWGTHVARQQQYVGDCWPGDAYMDAFTIDKYAKANSETEAAAGDLMVTQLQTQIAFTDAFCVAHGNKLSGNSEFGPKQSWGQSDGTPARDFTDRQAVQTAFMAEIDTWARALYAVNRLLGMWLFEKSIGNPPAATPDAYGTDEALCSRLFIARNCALGSTRSAWTATANGETWAANYPDVSEALSAAILL